MLIAEVLKLLGNSMYRKMIEAVKWQKNLVYMKDKKVINRALQSGVFSDLEEIREAYELDNQKTVPNWNRSLSVGQTVEAGVLLRFPSTGSLIIKISS